MVVRIDDSDLKAAMNHLALAFKKSSDGKRLKRELSKQLRKLMKPLVAERKAAVLRLPSKGHAGPSMRQAIAKQTRAAIRYSGRSTGVSVIQRGRSMPRDFNMAGRAFNREVGWNPTNLAGVQTHQEMRPTQWFDDQVKADRSRVRRDIIQAIGDMSDKMADDIRRIR
jgi:hypothetical protein